MGRLASRPSPARALAPLTLAILFGMVVGNTVCPKIWQPCDGGVIPSPSSICCAWGHPLRLSPDVRPDCRRRRRGGILIDVLTLSSTFSSPASSWPESVWSR
ncbi:hypothetical protein LNQ52_19125 [Klebsiella pneumoniae subsp. pneumoniae]|nr:hypothetical protein [Klebsiella pneumoniae subsp. pneumoniae]